MKLINGKKTYVHQQYWNFLLNLIRINETRTTAKVSTGARNLLKVVQKKGSLRSDDASLKTTYAELRPCIKELEQHLLCLSQSVHTDKGFHITELVSWETVQEQRKIKISTLNHDELDHWKVRFVGEYANQIRFPWKP